LLPQLHVAVVDSPRRYQIDPRRRRRSMARGAIHAAGNGVSASLESACTHRSHSADCLHWCAPSRFAGYLHLRCSQSLGPLAISHRLRRGPFSWGNLAGTYGTCRKKIGAGLPSSMALVRCPATSTGAHFCRSASESDLSQSGATSRPSSQRFFTPETYSSSVISGPSTVRSTSVLRSL
jgi:hypothetical protein